MKNKENKLLTIIDHLQCDIESHIVAMQDCQCTIHETINDLIINLQAYVSKLEKLK